MTGGIKDLKKGMSLELVRDKGELEIIPDFSPVNGFHEDIPWARIKK